ncbi:MAG: RecQ family ATP-dependent DNA helicase [Phocaeicola sp.]
MNRKQAEIILKNNFNLNSFYDEQWYVIDKILKGERLLLIERTGFGKSLCYQFPAIVLDGVTVIFSPLIALMRDQVTKLEKLGIPVACIHSGQTQEENTDIIDKAVRGKIKILYIAPERQENSEWAEATLKMKLAMVVVDEAHCISVWGHDFRPAFRRIIDLVNFLPARMPILATTATATKRVEADITEQMGNRLIVERGNLMRSNLQLHVIKVNSDEEKMAWLAENIQSLEGSGVLYCGTRVETEIYAKWLSYLGISSTSYNAGLDQNSRIDIERGFMENRWKCIISTNALGMGIDKPDIRFVIHTQIPQSPIHYYQEIGRAGRDGQPSKVILFYGPKDDTLPKSFIEGGRPSLDKYLKVIEAAKSDLLGEQGLMRRTNIKQTAFRVIRADLIEQKILREVLIGQSKKYEFIPNSEPLNFKSFEELREAKRKDLEKMIEYVNTDQSRMGYLCNYLGDAYAEKQTNCDNTGLRKYKAELSIQMEEKITDFRETFFPELEVESRGSNIVNGIAGSYYGVSTVGEAISRCKYGNGGDYPDFLLKIVLKAFRKHFKNEPFDLVLFVPPTKSGNLVRNFAQKVASVLKVPISCDLLKTRETEQQKIFENGLLKRENLKDAFCFNNPEELAGKRIILIDDVFDSGATIKEIGKYLTKNGAAKIAPVVIARTVGGDSV